MITKYGNFNAHLGKDSIFHTYHEQTNSNEIRLLEYVTKCSLTPQIQCFFFFSFSLLAFVHRHRRFTGQDDPQVYS